MPATERYALAARAMTEWSPDWNSLQFVSWAHGWKGIVLREAAYLHRLLAGRRLHMMFHEAWLTGEFEVIPPGLRRIRRHLLGQLQKHSVARLVRLLQPDLIDTSNAVYQTMLTEIGVVAGLLPLFGNIALAPPGNWQDMRTLVRAATGLDLGPDRGQVLLVGMFGTIRTIPMEPALRALFAAAGGRRTVLLSLGAAGKNGREHLQTWVRAVPGMEAGLVGVLDAERLSACFDQLDVAINLHPVNVAGRSGATAAFLEHGVPVISPWGAPPPANDAFAARWRDLLLPVDDRLTDRLRHPAPRQRRPDIADETARQVLSAMAAPHRLQGAAATP